MLEAALGLESLLNFWESKCLSCKWFIKMLRGIGSQEWNGLGQRYTGDESPWAECRKARELILAGGNDLSCFKVENWEAEKVHLEGLGFTSGMKEIPFFVSDWCHWSRRIYTIDRELQFLLAQTSIENYRWDEIPWPFPVMMVSLEVPLGVSDNGKQFKHIIISAHEGGSLKLFLFSDTSFQALPDNFETRMQFLISIRDWKAVREELKKLDSRIKTGLVGVALFTVGMSYMGKPIRENSLQEVVQKQSRNVDLLMELLKNSIKIAAALPFYLKSLPPHSPHISPCIKPWKIDKAAARGLLVTKQADICKVTSSYKLDDREREMLASVGGRMTSVEVRAHFRSGHFRRPPGKGDDSTAERTVWVRPTLVHRDRIEPGTLPGGTEVVLS